MINVGAGDVAYLDPGNETVIAHFEGEGESCDFICEVKNNGTQTDSVWRFKNGSIESDKIIGGYISGNYGNHLKIIDCSLRELDGVNIFCGSHLDPKKVFFGLKVCGELIGENCDIELNFVFNLNHLL